MRRGEKEKRRYNKPERSEGWRNAGTHDNLFEQVGQVLKWVVYAERRLITSKPFLP